MGARIASNMSCVHCKTTETPLWRAGPAGPKTLCNACGVRWKKTGSVIPRAKRPSATAPSSLAAPAAPSRADPSNLPANPARKRARTAPPAAPPVPAPPSAPAAPQNPDSAPRSTQPAHRHATRQRFPLPDPLPLPDPAARVAAAVLPAPRPVSVFRVSDAARSKYDSVFSGLMVVNRAREITTAQNGAARRDGADDTRPRTRTQSLQTAAHQQQLLHQQWLHTREEAVVPPSPSPPPVERPDRDAVYVTEVHAPSPSPSPPPMPRVQRMGEGGGFRLLLAAMVKDPKSTT